MNAGGTMDTADLKDFALAELESRKLVDIRVLDLATLTDFADYMVVASGQSRRQVVSAAEHLIEQAKHAHLPLIGSEGLDTGDWVLVDLADVIVHVMLPETREFYRLEELWEVSPQRLVESTQQP